MTWEELALKILDLPPELKNMKIPVQDDSDEDDSDCDQEILEFIENTMEI